MKVKKTGDMSYPDVEISDDINTFTIARKGLPDPCWFPNINAFRNSGDITFTIKEEDGNIYILFNKLYQDVINGNVFPLAESDIRGKSPEEIKILKREKAKDRAELRDKAQKSGLVNNGVINVHSEDYDAYDYASILTIKKEGKHIKIIFSKNKINSESTYMTLPSYHVRITESCSIYSPFEILFTNLHRQLQSLDWEKPNLTVNPTRNKTLSKHKQ
jgi:hypothetical protein